MIFAAGIVPAIYGATLTYTTTFPETSTDFSGALPIKQFDPALGSLSFLTISLTGDVEGTASITNKNTTAKTFNVTLTSDVTVVDPLLDVLVAILPTYSTSVTVPGNSTTPFSGTGGATQSNSYNDVPTLSEFTGTGNLAATINGAGSNGFMGPSNSTFIANTTAGGSVTITYNFLPIRLTSTPEPLTNCLIGSGLIGLGLLNRLKRRA